MQEAMGTATILLDPGPGPRCPQSWVPAQSLCPVSHTHESSVNTKGTLNTVSTVTLFNGHFIVVATMGQHIIWSGATSGFRDQTQA